jgi:hypothetical protein
MIRACDFFCAQATACEWVWPVRLATRVPQV